MAHLAPHQLASPVLQAVINDAKLTNHQIDEVICGNALGAGGNPARVLVLAAGLPDQVAGLTIDRQCCSGLDALLLGQGEGGTGWHAGPWEAMARRRRSRTPKAPLGSMVYGQDWALCAGTK